MEERKAKDGTRRGLAKGNGKGNRTRGKDRRGNLEGNRGNVSPASLEGLKKSSSDLAEATEHYRKIAEQRAGVIKYGVPFAAVLRDRLSNYIAEQQDHRRPVTIAGLIMAAGVDPDTWRRWRNEERDYLLFEYMDINGLSYDLEGTEIVSDSGEVIFLCRFSTLVKNAELVIQEQLESNCYTNKGNPAGSIFGLKAKYGWQDQPAEQRTANHNTLLLDNASRLDEAKDAIDRLSG